MMAGSKVMSIRWFLGMAVTIAPRAYSTSSLQKMQFISFSVANFHVLWLALQEGCASARSRRGVCPYPRASSA